MGKLLVGGCILGLYTLWRSNHSLGGADLHVCTKILSVVVDRLDWGEEEARP
jgi:hypothetical protein